MAVNEGQGPIKDDDLLLYCKTIPKVELHAHLNGSISAKTMLKLLDRAKRHGCSDIPEAWQTTINKEDKRTLEECFQVFKIVHQIVDDEDAVAMVATDVVEEFATDNVVYLELRTTPRANLRTGMTKESYIKAVFRGVREALLRIKSPIVVRILLSIDRSQNESEAEDTVQLAEKYNQSSQPDVKVVGVDLSGNPYVGDLQKLLPTLKSIKERGLKFAAHLSEISSRNEEAMLVITQATPDRIGHGTFMHHDGVTSENVAKLVKNSKIPLELCLTSNLKCKTVSTLKKHHFEYWRSHEHPVVLCTDDKGVFSTTLSEEFYLAAVNFGLSKDDLWQLAKNATNYIFEDDAMKQDIQQLWNSTGHH